MCNHGYRLRGSSVLSASRSGIPNEIMHTPWVQSIRLRLVTPDYARMLDSHVLSPCSANCGGHSRSTHQFWENLWIDTLSNQGACSRKYLNQSHSPFHCMWSGIFLMKLCTLPEWRVSGYARLCMLDSHVLSPCSADCGGHPRSTHQFWENL